MEEKIYRNTRNGNKFLEVVRYACGHYHVAQYSNEKRFEGEAMHSDAGA